MYKGLVDAQQIFSETAAVTGPDVEDSGPNLSRAGTKLSETDSHHTTAGTIEQEVKYSNFQVLRKVFTIP
jgi:hypothetical protein